jgi:hypothetical protein
VNIAIISVSFFIEVFLFEHRIEHKRSEIVYFFWGYREFQDASGINEEQL